MARTYKRDKLGRFAGSGYSGQSAGRGARLMASGSRAGGGAKLSRQGGGRIRKPAAGGSQSPATANAPKRLKFQIGYHGTSQEAAQSIRQGGYRETKYGTHGAGVYMTASKKRAQEYANWRSAGGKDRFGEAFPASAKGPAVLRHRLPAGKISPKGDWHSIRMPGNMKVDWVKNGNVRRQRNLDGNADYLIANKALSDRTLIRSSGTIRAPRRRRRRAG